MPIRKLTQFNIIDWYLATDLSDKVTLPENTSSFSAFRWGGTVQSATKPVLMPALVSNTPVQFITVRFKGQHTGVLGNLEVGILWTNYADAGDTAAFVQLDVGKWRQIVGANWDGAQVGLKAIELMDGFVDAVGEISGAASFAWYTSTGAANGFNHMWPGGFFGIRLQEVTAFTTGQCDEIIVELWG